MRGSANTTSDFYFYFHYHRTGAGATVAAHARYLPPQTYVHSFDFDFGHTLDFESIASHYTIPRPLAPQPDGRRGHPEEGQEYAFGYLKREQVTPAVYLIHLLQLSLEVRKRRRRVQVNFSLQL